jgi:hypothetical protein
MRLPRVEREECKIYFMFYIDITNFHESQRNKGGIKLRKPSIFSREYKRRMQRRRRKIISGIGIVLVIFIIMLSTGFFKSWMQSGLNAVKNSKLDAKSLLTGKENNTMDENKEPVESPPDTENKPDEITENKPGEEKFYEVKLQNGNSIKVIYEETTEGKKLKQAQGDSDIYFDLSPKFMNMVVWDKSSQNMMLVNADGTTKDITKQFYKTNNTKQIIQKDNQLKRRPNYVWCATPKFISEDAIVYISQLPLLSRSVNSIWVYEIEKDNHKQIYYKGAQNIVFNNFSNDALNITIDGKAKKILSSKKVVGI